jgi:hypothetical protein
MPRKAMNIEALGFEIELFFVRNWIVLLTARIFGSIGTVTWAQTGACS